MQKSLEPNINQIFAFSVMLFVTLRLADQVMLYRQVNLFGFTLTAGVFIMPFYYYMCDVIAELFGYKAAKRAVYYVLCCSLIFALLVTVLNQLPSPQNWKFANEYSDVLGHLLRSNLAAFIIVPLSSLLNAKIITKWKAITQGKYFWLRSLGSSGLAEAIQIIIGCLLLYTGVMPFKEVLSLIVLLYIVQIGCGVIIATPGLFIVNILKKALKDGQPHAVANPFKKGD